MEEDAQGTSNEQAEQAKDQEEDEEYEEEEEEDDEEDEDERDYQGGQEDQIDRLLKELAGQMPSEAHRDETSPQEGEKQRFQETEGLHDVNDLGRSGVVSEVCAGARVCFEWAPREWYLGKIQGKSRYKGWWDVNWEDKTKSSVKLDDSNTLRWFVMKDSDEVLTGV